MPKRKCTFNSTLQNKYAADVTCEKCRTDFSVGHGGASDIEKHLKSEKHRLSDQAAASSSSMLSFFKRTNLPTFKDMDIATAEGAWAYHTVQKNHSFRSNDCASNLIQTCFEQRFRCARTKSQAIVVNVLEPMATDELKDHLREAHCISLLTDASNHGSIKLFPVLIRYFLPYESVKVKILEFRKQPGETSNIVVDYLKEVATFSQTVLTIEGQNVSAIESTKEINCLRDNLAHKESSLFLPHAVRNIMVKLQETDAAVVQSVKTAATEFYKTSKKYLEQWCQFNADLEVFEWTNLTKVPTREEVQNVMDLLITQEFVSSNQDTE
ncbi:hypothetical protein ILUMI_15190, partial [Ignelater luminosus]